MASISWAQVKEFMEKAYHYGYEDAYIVDGIIHTNEYNFVRAYEAILDEHNKACKERDSGNSAREV